MGGFFRRGFDGPDPEPPRIGGVVQGAGDYECEVVGESHYQSAFRTICGPPCEGGESKDVTATLVLEDRNPHDKHAVAAYVEGHKVGYLEREYAASYRAQLTRQRLPLTLSCPGLIVGGWDRGEDDRGFYGIRLDLPVSD